MMNTDMVHENVRRSLPYVMLSKIQCSHLITLFGVYRPNGAKGLVCFELH